MESSTSTVQEVKRDGQSSSAKLKERVVKYSPSRSDNYATLRGLAYFCRYLSYCVIILTVPFWLALFAALGGPGGGEATAQIAAGLGVFVLILIIIALFIVFLFFGILSEMVFVQLDTEANTRQTAIILEKQLRSLSD